MFAEIKSEIFEKNKLFQMNLTIMLMVKLMVLEQTLLKYIVTHNSYGAPGCSPLL